LSVSNDRLLQTVSIKRNCRPLEAFVDGRATSTAPARNDSPSPVALPLHLRDRTTVDRVVGGGAGSKSTTCPNLTRPQRIRNGRTWQSQSSGRPAYRPIEAGALILIVMCAHLDYRHARH
jgi:hypothetical protein